MKNPQRRRAHKIRQAAALVLATRRTLDGFYGTGAANWEQYGRVLKLYREARAELHRLLHVR